MPLASMTDAMHDVKDAGVAGAGRGLSKPHAVPARSVAVNVVLLLMATPPVLSM